MLGSRDLLVLYRGKRLRVLMWYNSCPVVTPNDFCLLLLGLGGRSPFDFVLYLSHVSPNVSSIVVFVLVMFLRHQFLLSSSHNNIYARIFWGENSWIISTNINI